MSDVMLKDSKGRYHQVCVQLYASSCGPACVAMAERVYKHLNRSDESRARYLSQKYPGKWTISGGSYISNLSSILNRAGVKTYAAKDVTPAQVHAYLKHYAASASPVIAQIAWFGGGSHFVLCALRDHDNSFVFYDPFYGLVEQTSLYFPYYYAAGGKATSSNSALGWFNGWLAITHH